MLIWVFAAIDTADTLATAGDPLLARTGLREAVIDARLSCCELRGSSHSGHWQCFGLPWCRRQSWELC